MSEVDRRFHETWLGMVQPVDGLVVSVPVLVDAQCAERQPPHTQSLLHQLCPPRRSSDAGDDGYTVADLPRFLRDVLGYAPEVFDEGDALPEALSLYVPEGRQTLRPTLALRSLDPPKDDARAELTPAARAGSRYDLLLWQLPTGLDLDRAETVTGPWDYPPAAKFDRLLRHTRVPIGVLTNDECFRLIYAPHGESSGSITFRLDDLASVGGRPLLDAFVMLLSANRLHGVAKERALPAILAESRKRQANVTNDLADQVFEALQILLRGFEAAAERDGRALLDDALARDRDHLYKGLLTVLLRLVFVLYAEDQGLLPVDHPFYAQHLSALGLYEQLQRERAAWPDAMPRRFGAWSRLVALFRAVYLGAAHGDLRMPPRRGDLFDPHAFPFLEGWGPAGSAPIGQPEAQAAVRVPTVSDDTVIRVLEKLLRFEGQRLSYRALDVEQIGSIYEGLMGYHVQVAPDDAVCLRPDRVWVTPAEILAVPMAQRAKWIKETVGLPTAQSEKLSTELSAATPERRTEALARYAAGGRGGDPGLQRAAKGRLILQPGSERRRTSSHYTPRSLSEPIVRRTLEPLLAVMGENPPSERILALKVCDPAVGSGAFLVAACRFLADHLVAAWTREGTVAAVAADHGDPVLHARRLIAQRCLYGVDKNEAAVELAKLSLWLVTLSRHLPFTFVDHALRHGDSLVGLDFDQIRAFHWKKGAELELFGQEVAAALDEAVALRERILALAGSGDPADHREKERLLLDARDALERVKLLGDLAVGAFFAHDKDKDREKERLRRLELATAWLKSGDAAPAELREMQSALRARVPAFHWAVEFPEVFYAERPDPLDEMRVNRAAAMDAFIGNPPFLGGLTISGNFSSEYLDWLVKTNDGAIGKADLCVYFFRRAVDLLGLCGAVGMIATNSISETDSRETGLRHILARGGVVYDATRSMPWPGDAGVSVAVVHLAIGAVTRMAGRVSLDGRAVECINSSLKSGRDIEAPSSLVENRGVWYFGSTVIGAGFFLEQEEAARFCEDAGNSAVLRPVIGGEDINSTSTSAASRWIINFGLRPLEEARRGWPELMEIVELRVRPQREKIRRDTSTGAQRAHNWWQFAGPATALYEAIRSSHRCLACSQVSKYLMFSWQPTDIVFTHTAVVFDVSSHCFFSVVQSRVHELWARLHSSSLESRLRYSPGDCFDTYPFPQPDPRAVIPALEDIGERLYAARASYMLDATKEEGKDVGLTTTYNRLKDPGCRDPRIVDLRALHEEMDRAVLRAYGWDDLAVPPFCLATDADRRAMEVFEAAVIDRLFALNAERAKAERLAGMGDAKKAKGKKKGEPGKGSPQGSLGGIG